VNPRTGAVDKRAEVKLAGGVLELASPTFEEDIALRVRK
jgi:hypothetical protein